MQNTRKDGTMKENQELPEEQKAKAKEQIDSNYFSFNTKDNQNASQLAIENERLKTTILELIQKANTQVLCDEQNQKVQKSNDNLEFQLSVLQNANMQLINVNAKLKSDNELLMNANAKLKSENELYNFKIETRNIEIKALTEARNLLKSDNDDMQEKLLSQEKELFESKQVTIDLLEQISKFELSLKIAQA